MSKSWFMGLLAVAGLVGAVQAQDYPTRPVRLVVPFAAGGGADLVARAIAEELANRWKQPVVVENRTGAGSLIGAQAVATAPADGYTLFATTSQTFTTNRYLYKSLPYDIDKSFIPISLTVQADQFLLANPDLPASDLKQLVALARKPDSRLTYGSWGIGSEPQISYETLNFRERLNIVHVPYKGVSLVLAGLMGGEIQLTVGSAGVAGKLIESGKVKPLAIAAAKRSARFPDVPTTAEQGYPYVKAAILHGLFAPAGTPPAVVQKLGKDVRAALQSASLVEKLTTMGFDVVPTTGDEVTARLREETQRIGEVVEAAKIQPQ